MPPPGIYDHIPPPKGIELTAAGLDIAWPDGHRSVFPYRPLRLACPCAGCVEEGTGRRLLDPATVPADVRVMYQLPSGNYGLEILWSDRHSTGIYTFRWMRANCPCPACTATREVESESGGGGSAGPD